MTLLWSQGRPHSAITQRLGDCLESWRGTPYAEGQRLRGVASTCFGFVCGTLDEMFGKYMPDDSMPRDREMQSFVSATRAMLRVRRFYQPNRVVTEPIVWPGDVLVCGPNRRAAHAMIVGPNPNEVWETSRRSKVQPVPLASIEGRRDQIVRVYRMQELSA